MRLKKQPKVHRISRKNRRHPRMGRTFFSVAFTFLIAGAIGVLGYSVAKPILEFATGLSASTDSAQVQMTEAATVSGMETSTVATEEHTEETMVSQGMAIGVRLSETALESKTALQEAMAEARKTAPEGTVLVLPLKITGGEILYQSEVELAKQCSAVKGTLTLSEITSIVSADGWTPVAACSLLSDQLLPNADSDAGYRIEGDGSRWLDNAKENGGKPCVSPFSTVTQQYLCDLVKEMTAAGISQIWCEDVVFPEFRTSDLELIGSQVQDSGRGEILTTLLNQLAEAAGDASVLLCADVADAQNGTAEALQQPEQLEISGIVLELGTDTTSAAQTIQWASETVPALSLWMIAATTESTAETVPDAAQKAAAGWIWEKN